MSDNANGRHWARFWLVTSLVISVIGNVAHTTLAQSEISLWLRVPGAVIWPVFTFAAIEIVVRIVWRTTTSHRFARFTLLWVTVPAAVTSYEHLHSLLGMMGENRFIAVIGPLAIDGLMIGCTLTLLFTRNLPWVTIDPELTNVDAEILRLEAVLAEQQHADALAIETSPAGTGATRKARATWDASVVIPQIMDGSHGRAEIAVPDATYYRLVKVAKTLKANPRAVIDCRAVKVSPEHVHAMRELVGR